MFFHLVIGHLCWIVVYDAFGGTHDVLVGADDVVFTDTSYEHIQYVLFTPRMNWYTAHLACKGFDGYLATIETEDDINMVKDFIKDGDIWRGSWADPWIGLHEAGSSVVIDDDQCSDVGTDALIKDSYALEKCYRIKNGYLDIRDCKGFSQFICQRYIADNVTSAIVITGKADKPEPCSIRAGTLTTKTQYVLFTTKTDWHTARLICKGINGYLATIKERQLNAIKTWVEDPNVWKNRWDHSWTGLHIESGTTKVFDDYNCSSFDDSTLGETTGNLCYRVNKDSITLEEKRCGHPSTFICQRDMAEDAEDFRRAIVMGKDYHEEQSCPRRELSPVYTTTVTELQYVTSTERQSVTVSAPIQFVSVTATTTVTTTMTTLVVSTHKEVISNAAPTVTLPGEVLATTVRETSCITSTNVLIKQAMSTVLVTSMAMCSSLEPVHVTITASDTNSCVESTITLPAEVTTTVSSCIASTNVVITQPMSTVFVTSMATCSSVEPITHVSTVQNPCSCSSFPVNQNYIRVDKHKTTICRTYNNTVPDVKEVEEAVAAIVSELTVETKNLSKTVRAKTSTPDRRFSSQSIGLTSVCIVFLPFAVIVLLDCTTIVREMRTSFLNIKGHGFP